MNVAANPNRDVTQLYLRWRSDLVATPRTWRGRPGYLVEDPVSGQFHRLGEREYKAAIQCDGNIPVGEVVQRCVGELEPNEILVLVRWLTENRLVEVFDAQGNIVSNAAPRRARSFDPFFIRFSLWKSPPFFAGLLTFTAWLFSRNTVVFLTLATFWLGVQFSLRWEQVVASSTNIFAPDQHVRMFMVWLVLKVIHELAHGLVCRKYGGEVRELGISLMFGMPTPYVDVTNAWRFPSRWQRIATSLAGMYAEWVVAVVAGFLWLSFDDPVLRQTCVQILFLVGLGTIVFNANPLMRFDGYYVLTDLYDHPNLATEAQRVWSDLWQRWMVGNQTARVTSINGFTLALFAYGAAALVWRIMSLTTLALTTIVVYEGVGLALVGLAVFLWFGRIIYRCGEGVYHTLGTAPMTLLRPTAIVAVAATLLGLTIVYAPWPFASQAVGVVGSKQEVVLRTDSAGIVAELCVRDGDEVTAGQLLLRLRNDELELSRRQAATACATSEFKALQLRQERKLVEWRAELERHQTLQRQLADLEQKVAALEIHSPIAGRLFARRWQDWLDRFVPAGEALGIIGQPDSIEIKVAIPQTEVQRFADSLPLPVMVVTSSLRRFPAELVAMESQAQREPFDPSLAVTAGGSLAVREAKGADGKTPMVELLEPHFTATVQVDTTQSGELLAGQRCRVRFEGSAPTIAMHLYALWQKWQQKFQPRDNNFST